MGIVNPFSITYGSRTVGGATAYQLHDAYVIDKAHDNLRLVFEVVVVAVSYSNLTARSDALEDDFSKRLSKGQSLVINLGGSTWTYTHGSTILKARSTIQKSGDIEKDKGYARSYIVTIEGELPASDAAGLRDIEVLVDKEPGGQKFVTMRGTYTATSSSDALTTYTSLCDTEAGTYLTLIDSAASFELVDETYTLDREKSGSTPYPHLCNFTRQYVELLANQSRSQLDDTSIRDHKIVFTKMHQQPGDSRDNIYRLRRVAASYECWVDIDQTTDLRSVYDSKIKTHVSQLFRDNYNPRAFAIEDQRVTYDETAKVIAVATLFVYQPTGGGQILEMSEAVAYRERRFIDYTPVHGPDELAAEADLGFATVERIWTRTVITAGDEYPKRRIAAAPKFGPAGAFSNTIGGEEGPDKGGQRQVEGDGWNIVENMSQVTPQWIVDPEGQPMQTMVLTETILERLHTAPKKSGARTGR